MFDPVTILIVILLYVGVLLAAATKVEQRAGQGLRYGNNAWVYSLSLAIYCTSWSFYGTVGLAATSGMLFTCFYLGPALAAVFWWTVLRRMVRLKNFHHTSSIADFIAARYNSSQLLAAMATLIALLGIAPYIALQFKAVVSTFSLIASRGGESWLSLHAGPVMAALMIVFTIVFGVRRLDPTEQHQGMIMAVAIQSVVKLAAFLAVGVFVVCSRFGGLEGMVEGIGKAGIPSFASQDPGAASFVTWGAYLVLSMAAIMFLPRQFHVAVVENADENHIKTAMWAFPAYTLLISLFVLPIAAAGILSGLDPLQADTFVLELPLRHGSPWLVMLVFLGGFSAAMSMIMISSMTMATMLANHILLPLADLFSVLGFLRKQVLKVRWAGVILVVLLGYWFEKKLGNSYTLSNMGVISFAAALQFAPPILGGLFWAKGNRQGAIWGLGAGFVLWAYTLLIPSFARSGWISAAFLDSGPWGWTFLNPEGLLGLSVLPPVSHAVFWTLTANAGLYVLVSLLTDETGAEARTARKYVDVLSPASSTLAYYGQEARIRVEEKCALLLALFNRFLSPAAASNMLAQCLDQAGLGGRQWMTVVEWADLCGLAESLMAGAIGAPAAGKTFRQAALFDEREALELSALYGEMLADLRLTPEELRRKIDYYQEREALVASHAAALEEKVRQLREEIRKRRQTELELTQSEARYRVLLDTTPDAVVAYDSQGRVQYVNQAFESAYGWTLEELAGKTIDFVPAREQEVTHQAVEAAIKGERPEIESQRLTRSGAVLDVLLKSAPFFDQDGNLAGCIVLHHDITQRKRAQEMLAQTEKMISLGGLAAGMAHEINNPLAGILQNVQVIFNRLTQGSPRNQEAARESGTSHEAIALYLEKRGLLKMFSHVMESGERAARIVENMLSFSRAAQEPHLQSVDLCRLIDQTLDIASSDFNIEAGRDFRQIRIVREFEPSLPTVQCEAVKIQQVLLNLLMNAAQAMADCGEGAPRPMIVLRVRAAGPGQVAIEVEDNGPGMEEDVRKRAFEPFFTTKAVGVGTGLGLSVAYFIVTENHGGTMRVESAPGSGARFIITLPEKPEGSSP